MLFPGNKRFAFSILDDTDDSTLENVKPVYDFLRQSGFRTTKSAWPLDCPEGSTLFFAADTLQNKAYLDFVHELVGNGFELAFHGATMESSLRERTAQAFELWRQKFGKYPRVFCNHGHNRENLYWGCNRFQTVPLRLLARLIRKEPSDFYSGEREESEYFWGDICKEHISYVRNFTFNKINMLECNPEMPYQLRRTKYVNYWFSTADAPDVNAFNRLLSRDKINTLERSGGVCIVSTHLGKGFVKNGELNSRTRNILEYIARKRGWFVPVADILDHIVTTRGGVKLGYLGTLFLEVRFVMDKIRAVRKTRAYNGKEGA